MYSPKSNLRTIHPLQLFSLKSSSSSSSSSPSSTLSSMKLKSLIHTLIISNMCRIIRALSKVKDVIVEILKDNNSTIHFPYLNSHKKHYNNKRKKIILGSFRLHYNWCSSKSSHVLPVPQPVYEGLSSNLYHDTTWKNTEQFQGEDCDDSELAGYLRWLEEKKVEDDNKGTKEEQEMNEIDMLAEMFIANCHEKFRLEKQESDRRFQEMLARSI